MRGRIRRIVAGAIAVLAAVGGGACASRTETRSNSDNQTYSTSVTIVGNKAAALLEQGRKQAAQGDFAGAVRLYNEALSSPAAKPEHRAQALLALGQAYGSPLNLQRDPAQALAYYERVVAEYPEAPERAEAEKAIAALRAGP